ncbi:S-layer homology domain-containing protein [Bacillus sp. ISL-41]|nr:S-layer homology domain-containing protein [Bacillus sp. ISL-41]
MKGEASQWFKDLPSDYWAKGEIDFLISEEIIAGYHDGTFRPADSLTRIQVAIMIDRAMDFPVKERPDPRLQDIKAGSKYYSIITTLLDEGVFYDIVRPEGYFYPNAPVTRDEMASILVRTFDLTGTTAIDYSDVEQDQWAYRYIQKLVANGVTAGTTENTFSPEQPLNRVQFAAFLARTLDERFRLPQSLPKPAVEINDYFHDQDEINQKWQQYKPTYEGHPYEINPIVKSPFSPGKLNDDFINDGVKMTNFVRYLSGLPTVVEDSSLNELSQYGAVVTAANGFLSHHPEKPMNMDENFFHKGYQSTSSSNLFQFYEGSPMWFFKKRNMEISSPLAFTVAGYMSDSDMSNIDRVGHRRWILSQYMGKVGFGMAASESGIFSAMQVFDKSRVEGLNEWDYTSWPAKGYFPYQFLHKTDAWSVQLNRYHFKTPNPSDVKVHLIRLNDEKEWNLDMSHNTVTEEDNYFNVENQNFGYSTAIIFRPGEVDTYENSTYKITITGLQRLDGQPATIQYTTYFFEMKE